MNLSDLPNELIDIILDYLNLQDLIRLAATNKKFRSIALDRIRFAHSRSFGDISCQLIRQSPPEQQQSIMNHREHFLKYPFPASTVIALALERKGGIAAGIYTTFFWYKNNLSVFGKCNFGSFDSEDRQRCSGGDMGSPWGEASILRVAVGDGHVFVSTTNGLWVHGKNSMGQLGLGHTQEVSGFTRVGGGGDPPWGRALVLDVVTEELHTLVWTTNGLWGCGLNIFGQIGLPNTRETLTFARVGDKRDFPWGNEPIIKVVTCTKYTLVLTQNGLWGCGISFYKWMGREVRMENGSIAASDFIRVGENEFSFLVGAPVLNIGITESYFLIYNKNGMFFCGLEDRLYAFQHHHKKCTSVFSPKRSFTPLYHFQAPPWEEAFVLGFAVGDEHLFVWTTDGLWGCGSNSSGQLGLGDRNEVPTLTRIGGHGDPPWGDALILNVCTNKEHTLVLTTNGLWGCGRNSYGELGLVGHRQIHYFACLSLDPKFLNKLRDTNVKNL